MSFGGSKTRRSLAWVRERAEAQELALHPDKTRLVDAARKARSILRKRAGRKGRGRGADHQRYPNAYFAELGLFRLVEAHALVCPS